MRYDSSNCFCDPAGEPYLRLNLEKDNVNYPVNLSRYLLHIWKRANAKELTDDQVQEALDQLAGWVSNCERDSPNGIW